MNINIYTNDKDKEWISLAEKVASLKEWSLSKVIKYVMRKALVEGAMDLAEAPLKEKIEKKLEENKLKEAIGKEKITPDNIFKEFEDKQKEEEEKIIHPDKNKSMEQLAIECDKKDVRPDGRFMCHYKNQQRPLYPVCIICWRMQEIWGKEAFE